MYPPSDAARVHAFSAVQESRIFVMLLPHISVVLVQAAVLSQAPGPRQEFRMTPMFPPYAAV